ncbi:MAG: biotin--[acetyl-CoA-carboxylase] ligase [bacterium]
MYIGTNIQVLEKVDSTNAFLKNNTDIYQDGTIIIAKVQSHGRGRFERKWISDIKGNLYCSILTKDTAWLKNLTHLPIFMAVILRRAIITAAAQDAPSLCFKWPNDLASDGAKLAGILIESTKAGLVIGIGLNIKKAPKLASNRTTTSMYELFTLYKDLEPSDLVGFLVGCYNSGIKEYMEKGFDVFKKEWEAHSCSLNKNVALNEGIDDNTVKQIVTFKGLNDDGGAIMVDASGKEKVIYYGELSDDV